MRKLFASLLLLFALASTGAAAPVLAPPSPNCNLFGTGPANDLSIPFATWTGAGFNCEMGDKIYSNFAIAGLPTNTVLELQSQTVGGFDIHGVTFNGNFIAGFVLSYDIAVDLVMNPNGRIVRVSGDLSNPSAIGNPATAKVVFSEGGTNLGVVTSTVGSPGVPLVVQQTALHIVDTYAPFGGAAVSVSNAFVQAEVPEPATLSVIGVGLVGLAFLKKRKA